MIDVTSEREKGSARYDVFDVPRRRETNVDYHNNHDHVGSQLKPPAPFNTHRDQRADTSPSGDFDDPAIEAKQPTTAHGHDDDDHNHHGRNDVIDVPSQGKS